MEKIERLRCRIIHARDINEEGVYLYWLHDYNLGYFWIVTYELLDPGDYRIGIKEFMANNNPPWKPAIDVWFETKNKDDAHKYFFEL